MRGSGFTWDGNALPHRVAEGTGGPGSSPWPLLGSPCRSSRAVLAGPNPRHILARLHPQHPTSKFLPPQEFLSTCAHSLRLTLGVGVEPQSMHDTCRLWSALHP